MRNYWVVMGSVGNMVKARSGHEAASKLRRWIGVRGVPATDEKPRIGARSTDRLTYVYRWSDGYVATVTSEWALR